MVQYYSPFAYNDYDYYAYPFSTPYVPIYGTWAGSQAFGTCAVDPASGMVVVNNCSSLSSSVPQPIVGGGCQCVDRVGNRGCGNTRDAVCTNVPTIF